MFSKSLSHPTLPADKAANIVIAWPAITLAALLFLFVSVRLWKMAAYPLWGGELFTMIGVEQGWQEMISYIVSDIVHPPLFYILLKVWTMMGGQSLLWLKLFPVLSGTAVVVPFILLCREMEFRLPEINLALLLLAVNGYLIHYTQELRMYSLFLFLAVCSFWLFMRFFKPVQPVAGQLVLLTLVNLLLIYTHYYGWIVVGVEFLFLLIWQRRLLLAFALTILFLLLCFAPWAFQVIEEARSIGGLKQNLDWIPKPGLTDLLNFYVTLNGPLGFTRSVKLLGLLVFGLPLMLWLWQLIRTGFTTQREEAIRFSWLALLSCLPVVGIFLVSQGLPQAVWIDRYFLFIAIPYMMWVAAAVYRLQRPWLRNIWLIAIVLWSLVAGLNDLRTNRMAWEGPQVGSRVAWDILAQQMVEAEGSSLRPIKVYSLTVVSKGLRTGDWAIATSLAYYLEALNEDRFQIVYVRDTQALLHQAEEDTFWIAYFRLVEWPQPSPARLLTNNGYEVGDGLVFQEKDNSVILLPVWRR